MTEFSKKEIRLGEHVGDIIRSLRDDAGMSRGELAQASHVDERFIVAFEEFTYQLLPGDVYAKNFLRSFATVFGVNADRLVKKYEEDTKQFPFKQSLTPKVHTIRNRFWTSQRLTYAGLVIAILGVISYVGFELRGFIISPNLRIIEPNDNSEITNRELTVKGLTDKGVSITINGAPVPVTDEGTFTATIDVTPGVNSLAIVAKHKFGSESRVVRNIFARP